MKISELNSGTKYIYKYENNDPEIVEFSRPSRDGDMAICHPPGEPDMQSSFIIDPKYLIKKK